MLSVGVLIGSRRRVKRSGWEEYQKNMASREYRVTMLLRVAEVWRGAGWGFDAPFSEGGRGVRRDLKRLKMAGIMMGNETTAIVRGISHDTSGIDMTTRLLL